jgi:hypothetical protein
MKKIAIILFIFVVVFGLSILKLYNFAKPQILFIKNLPSDLHQLVEECKAKSVQELTLLCTTDPVILDKVDNQILQWEETRWRLESDWISDWHRDPHQYWRIISPIATWGPPELIHHSKDFLPSIIVIVLSLCVSIASLLVKSQRGHIMVGIGFGVILILLFLPAVVVLVHHYFCHTYDYDEYIGSFPHPLTEILHSLRTTRPIKVTVSASFLYGQASPYLEKLVKDIVDIILWFGCFEITGQEEGQVVANLMVNVKASLHEGPNYKRWFYPGTGGSDYAPVERHASVEGEVLLATERQVFSHTFEGKNKQDAYVGDTARDSERLAGWAIFNSLGPQLLRTIVESFGPAALARAIRMKEIHLEIGDQQMAYRNEFFLPALVSLGEEAEVTLVGLSRSGNEYVSKRAAELLKILKEQQNGL